MVLSLQSAAIKIYKCWPIKVHDLRIEEEEEKKIHVGHARIHPFHQHHPSPK